MEFPTNDDTSNIDTTSNGEQSTTTTTKESTQQRKNETQSRADLKKSLSASLTIRTAMDRFMAMVILLGILVTLLLVTAALFAVAPIICCCFLLLLYSLYLFMAYEESGVHHAQEFENRFWTIFALFLSAALFFAKDSPLAFGWHYSPTLGLWAVVVASYCMHVWDRYAHRVAISSPPGGFAQPLLGLRRCSINATVATSSAATNDHHGSTTAGTGAAGTNPISANTHHGILSASLLHLRDLGIPVEAQLTKIHQCLQSIDQLLIPSTINNFINLHHVQAKEREIISIFEDCDARALNYLIGHVKLGLLFYKIKDHRNFHGKHRTELIHLLAVERLSILTVMSRVILLHSLQLLKLRANPKAEYWVRHILLNTHQDDLSELKTLTDAKGDYFCMNKLIYDDIRSESIRQEILHHIRREAAVQQTHWQMGTKRKKRLTLSARPIMTWRKVLSDVDDTLYCSGGMYPAGIDKRYPKKTVYPGVLAFYRELDLGTQGPEEWEDNRVGNLVFLSARPHVYKDMSEKHNFAKFEKLRARGDDGRKGMHTTPSLLAGDLTSGSQFFVSNDFEPLARKKFDNFRRYVNLYPEYQHVFVCDNGQGDVRAGEMMFDGFPYELEALYVHIVQDVTKTYGYNPQQWRRKEFSPFFFRTYPEAALHAASRHPPLIRVKGLQRICQDAVKDFLNIRNWASEQTKAERRKEINQAVWRANRFLEYHNESPVELILAERLWRDGEKVRTPYGIAVIRGFDPAFDLYHVDFDWRPLDIQVKDHEEGLKSTSTQSRGPSLLSPVLESDENDDETRTQECGQPSAEIPAGRRSKPISAPNSPFRPKTNVDNTARGLSLANVRPAVRGSVSGRCISKYVSPPLPKLGKPNSIFTFFSASDLPKRDSTPKRRVFAPGEECSTPYGLVTVLEYRENDKIVVVDMLGWHAQGYLHESIVLPLPRNILRSFLRQFSADSGPKQAEFPYATGTPILTPFGRGTVRRPIPAPIKGRCTPMKNQPSTIGIGLDSWTLANGTHPTLFCTVETAKAWKDRKLDDENTWILSSLGSAIMTSSRSLLEPFLQPPKEIAKQGQKPIEQYFCDGASVVTPYGNARVQGFRGTDGMYTLELVSWSLATGKHAKAFVRGVDMNCRIAKDCREGCPVLTCFGMTGTLATVEPRSGVHVVTIPSAGMVCYLQPESIVCPLKASIGEDVVTMFGDGKVTKYNAKSATYAISLPWNATLYAKGDKFDCTRESIQDHESPFGVSWLLRLLFFSSPPTKDATPVTRSRSNSVVSGKSQK